MKTKGCCLTPGQYGRKYYPEINGDIPTITKQWNVRKKRLNNVAATIARKLRGVDI